MMTLKGLKREIKKLARGGYHCVREEITEYDSGKVKIEYKGYIAWLTWTNDYEASEGVLRELENMIKEKGD